MVANDVVVLPLSAASDGTARWIATDCQVFPTFQPRYQRAPVTTVHAYRQRGAELVRHVHLSQVAVAAFQRYCDGDPDPMIAGEELREILAADARAVRTPPSWCRLRKLKGDFFIVSADEYVLPMSRRGTRGYAFEALDCVHRASDLIGLRGSALAERCRYEGFAAVPSRRDALLAALRRGGQLTWRRPKRIRGYRSIRLWINAGSVVAPVVWQPADVTHPLLVPDVIERLTPVARLTRWWAKLRPRDRTSAA
ncbi:MAG: hypothetical protein ACRDT6_11715 [Micromonosporaceae bacterium]